MSDTVQSSQLGSPVPPQVSVHPSDPTAVSQNPQVVVPTQPTVSLPNKEYAPMPAEIPLQDVMKTQREPELAPALMEAGVEHSSEVKAEQALSQAVNDSDLEFAKESVPHPPTQVMTPSLPPLPKSQLELEEEVKNLPPASSGLWKAVLILKQWKERLIPKSTL